MLWTVLVVERIQALLRLGLGLGLGLALALALTQVQAVVRMPAAVGVTPLPPHPPHRTALATPTQL